ncbi:cupin domain-containing protein [Aestuariirhabdus sp. Z084]|uniref:cupin domain-containing protein n=1 Tax=Aestuariirhabdus haliotis TaxID=2918751 RepID=UPI00201B3CE6|nr:cupin domain-containing protein [Aestuariirhabdus haliotis]MCL6414897.1 cupin domain-containing protein [Aestuariirhabdus haliotis]MCL6418829.1 cupin domain-containing protein [Aestuariirhabdus haliotis]
MTTHPFLGNVSPKHFLNEYWQKKPLLIRQAIPGFGSHLPPEELAGLALEEEVESRLVVQSGDKDWQLFKGPFDEQRFAQLPQNRWSLLIQGADQWLDEVNTLLRSIDFIPSWRVDDVMISYATDQGSVGPHYDNYDVFLLQAEGTRSWQLGQWCDHTTPLLPHPQLKLLQEFLPSQEYVLEPGDMLYVPTRLAHHGVSRGDSISYSLGFRAPATADLLSRFCDELCSQLPAENRYQDSDLELPSASGEIDQKALTRVRQLLLDTLDNPELLRDFFGRYVTEPKFDEPPQPEAVDMLAEHACVQLTPGHRLAFTQTSETLELFADGVRIVTNRSFFALCQQVASGFPFTGPFNRDQQELLTKLLALGTIELID